MAISTTAFTKTPQATDDSFTFYENSLSGSYPITLDVMANDLGGNAKALWSIDDGNGNVSAVDNDLLTQDKTYTWEALSANNVGATDKIEIVNGQVVLDASASL